MGNEVDGRLVYRLLVGVDVEQYSKRPAREQFLAQQALHAAMESAVAAVGLDYGQWHRQVSGDGELAVLPPATEVTQVVGVLGEELERALAELNERFARRPPLRVRLALHYGTLTWGPFGPAGDAPIVVSRLLDAKPIRRFLIDRPDRNVGLIISDALYRDVVETGFCRLSTRDFRAVRITAKGTTYHGYVYEPAVQERVVSLRPVTLLQAGGPRTPAGSAEDRRSPAVPGHGTVPERGVSAGELRSRQADQGALPSLGQGPVAAAG